MNNAKKLLICISVLFITLLFQIGIIIKLNILDNRLNEKTAYASTNHNIINNETTNNSDSNENNTETIPEETSSEQNPSSDSDYVSEDDYASILSNSLFIGDSRTEGIRKFTSASNYSHFCCDVGISINDIISESFFIGGKNITLTEAIANNKYTNIFICIGYNELGWDYENVFIEKYGMLINHIKELSPASNIYIQTILNITNNANVYEEAENNDRINLYNSKIEEMCKEKNVTCINLNREFNDENGCLRQETTEDGIHFKNDYYNQYLEKLILYLKTK